jgi:uncharacterized protein YcbK (DUF882 family)
LAGLSVVKWARRRGAASRAATAAVLLTAWLAPDSTESAVANGDTRTVVFSNPHTGEEGSFTFMVNGVYDQATLDKLNWFMRDWRINEPTKMDPHLFDIVWEVYRESGSREPIEVLSGYRSPQTNAMLRRRSRQVAEHSQHMEGRAIDAHFVDVGPDRIRDIAMRMQEGGVGFYPTGVTWVHIDSGSVRYWPRMSRAALTRLFPDGKTVFIPSDGQPMPGYELAKAEIEQRGGEIQTASGGGLFAWLFGARGGGADDAEERGGQEAVVTAVGGRGGGRSGGGGVQVADAGSAAFAQTEPAPPNAPAPKQTPAPKRAPAPAPAPQPEVVATLEQPSVESDAAPEAPANLTRAPLPPRRPSERELLLASIAKLPLPPARPTDLVVAEGLDLVGEASPLPPIRPAGFVVAQRPDPVSGAKPLPPVRPSGLAAAPDMTASIAPTPPVRPASFAVPANSAQNTGAKALPAAASDEPEQLPKAITAGLGAPPTHALALAELPPAPQDDREALLKRAADLSAPLPPMAIRAPGPAPEARSAAAPRRSAWARLWSAVSFGSFRSAPSPQDGVDLRGSQQ